MDNFQAAAMIGVAGFFGVPALGVVYTWVRNAYHSSPQYAENKKREMEASKLEVELAKQRLEIARKKIKLMNSPKYKEYMENRLKAYDSLAECAALSDSKELKLHLDAIVGPNPLYEKQEQRKGL